MGTPTAEDHYQVALDESRSAKFAKTMEAQDKEDEQKHGGTSDEWVEEMSDVYEAEVAPAEIQEMFDHQDGLKNKAMFILADGSVSEEMGAGSIAKLRLELKAYKRSSSMAQSVIEFKKLLLKHPLLPLSAPNLVKDSVKKADRNHGSLNHIDDSVTLISLLE